MPINRQVITFLSIVASCIESPIIAIIKAIAVPRGIPFATNTSMIGTMPAALAYIGTIRITASGTPNSIPPLTKPIKSGTEEQDQNGVIPPNRTAKK